jgi:hypothetical protein
MFKLNLKVKKVKSTTIKIVEGTKVDFKLAKGERIVVRTNLYNR